MTLLTPTSATVLVAHGGVSRALPLSLLPLVTTLWTLRILPPLTSFGSGSLSRGIVRASRCHTTTMRATMRCLCYRKTAITSLCAARAMAVLCALSYRVHCARATYLSLSTLRSLLCTRSTYGWSHHRASSSVLWPCSPYLSCLLTSMASPY